VVSCVNPKDIIWPDKSKLFKMVNIVCDGNSITYGVGYGPGLTWPQQLATLAPWAAIGSNLHVYNFGVNSQTTQNMQSDAATQIDPLYDPAAVNILIAWEIRNDVQNGLVGVTPRQAVDHMKAYCLARKAVGWKVIVVDILHSNFVAGGASQEDEDLINANYDACNTIVAGEWQEWADGYVHMMADSRLANPHDATVYYDGIHPNGLGRQYAAEDINPEVVRIYNSVNPNVGLGSGIVVAKQTVAFADCGISADNTRIIYKVGPNGVLSFKPERSINGITGFEAQNGYFFIAKQPIALGEFVSPPLN
jgi:lysophospholipase L1-like esterase